MKDVKELEADLKEINSQIADKDREIKEVEKRLNADPEMKELKKRYATLFNLSTSTRRKQDKIAQKIKEKFLDEGQSYPSHSRDYSNILYSVVEAIKSQVNISKLRGSDVEDIVKKMIERERAGSREFQGTRQKLNEVDEESDKLYGEIEARKKQSGLHEKGEERYVLIQKKEGIEQLIRNPKIVEQQEEKTAEREKVGNQKVIDAIYKEFKS